MRIDQRIQPSIMKVLDREHRRYELALARYRRISSVTNSGSDIESLFSLIGQLRNSIQDLASDETLGLKTEGLPADIADIQTRLHAILDDMLKQEVVNMIDQQVSQVVDRAQRDPVTNVANRAAFDQRLAAEIDHARIHNRNLSIILFDVDHFKCINDQFGHPSGDQVLKEIAMVLQSSLRNSDLVFRYGGDEFAAICPATSETALKIIRTRIDQRLKAHFENSAFRGYIGTSAGGATYPLDGAEADTLVRVADQRLYECKRDRRFSAGARN